MNRWKGFQFAVAPCVVFLPQKKVSESKPGRYICAPLGSTTTILLPCVNPITYSAHNSGS